MKCILSEFGTGFNLIAENNAEKAFIRNLWEKKTSKMKNKEPFAIHLYGHLFDGTEHWSNTPFQIQINSDKYSGHAEGWKNNIEPTKQSK